MDGEIDTTEEFPCSLSSCSLLIKDTIKVIDTVFNDIERQINIQILIWSEQR